VLNEITSKDYKVDQILEAEGIWAVFYHGKPINLKSFNMLVHYANSKYKKVSFSNSGHAINLAKKLNKQFSTDAFTVVKLLKGAEVYPGNDQD